MFQILIESNKRNTYCLALVSKLLLNSTSYFNFLNDKLLPTCPAPLPGPCAGCEDGEYGINCNGVCECENNGVCDVPTGTCYCRQGFTGATCEKRCPDNRYGFNCTGVRQLHISLYLLQNLCTRAYSEFFLSFFLSFFFLPVPLL